MFAVVAATVWTHAMWAVLLYSVAVLGKYFIKSLNVLIPYFDRLHEVHAVAKDFDKHTLRVKC